MGVHLVESHHVAYDQRLSNLKNCRFKTSLINAHETSQRSFSMSSRILADVTASVTELQKDPMGAAASGNGATVAILKRNTLAFYCVPAGEYHAMVDRLEDIELNALAEARRGGPFVEVGVAEL